MQSNSSEFLAEALTQLRKENTDPLTILLVSQAQARLEHKQEIERLDRDLDQHKKVHAQQLQKFQEELYSGQKLLESVRQDIDAIHNNKDTFNVCFASLIFEVSSLSTTIETVHPKGSHFLTSFTT